MSITLLIIVILACLLAFVMLFAKNPITTALCLLGILLLSAATYALMGEHFVATLQLVVYAGAIMVLFIFSIMLLNLNQSELEIFKRPKILFPALFGGLVIFAFIGKSIADHFAGFASKTPTGPFTSDVVLGLGGNAKVLSHALFSQFYLSFEVISLALLVAVVGAVVLAKRKFD